MSIIRPFRALRPLPAVARHVSAVPYDVVSAEEARSLAGGNLLELSSRLPGGDRPSRCDRPILGHRIRPCAGEFHAPPGLGAARDRGRAGGGSLPAANGSTRADGPGGMLFARRIRARTHQEARADAAGQGRRPDAAHRHAARADRSGLFDVPRVKCDRRGSSSGPLRRRLCSTSSLEDQVRHTLWRVTGADESELVRAFGAVSCLYISDGHHRAGERRESAETRRRRGTGHGNRESDGCSPWRFRTTRCRSCLTTAWSETWQD